ncbi:hypothetical protein ABEG93_10420 [Pantoea agglomerans]|jgi:hypothetical protein|uniref:hypothetical protein n=1 Tax=Enterobacter agglomerans TaxID=549 RepID=UPI002543CD43|nr:hypothetical protein [Pantoea agglomerans]MDK4216439.1 hypothetical protein [Pantoea agglomerans]
MEDYGSAAKRHFGDAKHLESHSSWDNAGHLLGLGVECALKKKCSITRADIPTGKGHLPDFIFIAKKKLNNRTDAQLIACLNSQLFSGWVISNRYHTTGSIDQACYKQWLQQATNIYRFSGIKK